MYCHSTVSAITNSVFYRNTRSTGNGSSLFYLSSYGQVLTNSIIWSNDPGSVQDDLTGVDLTTVSYSNVEDSIGPTNNNISVEPNFAGADYNNYRLRTESLCIDAGSEQADWQYDFDGEQRPYGDYVDIGIDEFSDNDGDALPDFFELTYFGDHSAVPTGDPDFDGRLNIDEYYQDKNPTLSD